MDCPRVITADWLREVGACMDEVSVFEGEWPRGAEVTEENVLRAQELGLDIDWLVTECASLEGYRQWRTAQLRSADEAEKAELFVKLWKEEG